MAHHAGRDEGAIRERDALKRELQAAHEARDAAEVLDAVRNIEPDSEIDDTAIESLNDVFRTAFP